MKKNDKSKRGFSNEVILGIGTGANVIGGGTAVIRGKTPHIRTSGMTVDEQLKINTDPFGSWTGVPTDDPYEKPIQDADDL